MSTSAVTILRELHGATSIHAIEGFTSYFRRSPDQLGPDPVREYQVHVFCERKLSPHSIEGQTAALQWMFLKPPPTAMLPCRSANVRRIFRSIHSKYREREWIILSGIE
jgi:hypothetical protein